MSDILDSTSENILAGHFSEDDFPVIPAKIVKVYLSAAGNGMSFMYLFIYSLIL